MNRSSFAGVSPGYARGVLWGALAVAALFVGVTLSPWRSGYADAADRGPGDVTLYRAEVERIAAGAGYYEAAGHELRARGYPTRSVFNWRTPLPVWLLGSLPDPRWGQAALCGAALLLLGLSFALIADEAGLWAGGVCVAAMSGALLPCLLGDLFVMPVLWSGVFVALSVAAYGTQRRRLGFASALTALFLRELAAPACLIAAGLAVRERRWREVVAWGVGFAAYAVFLGWHAATVQELIRPEDRAHDQGWLRLGGAAFVLSTSQMNAYLLLLPQWATALFVAAAVVGFAGWNTAAGQRAGLTAAAYLAAMALVGQPFNQYWGCQFAPLLCLGVGLAPRTLADLGRAARGGFAPRGETLGG